jgi:hypothetical protein
MSWKRPVGLRRGNEPMMLMVTVRYMPRQGRLKAIAIVILSYW